MNTSTILARPFVKIGLLVIPLLLFMFAMSSFHPKSFPDNYTSFIIAFEFVKTPDDVQNLFRFLDVNHKLPPTNQAAFDQGVQGLNTLNYIDFGLMISYALFLFLFSKKASTHYNLKWMKWGMLFAIVSLISDFGENICLINIANSWSDEGVITPYLTFLPFLTWAKWLSIAGVLGLAAVAFLYGKKLITKLVSFALIMPALIGFAAVITQAPPMIDAFCADVLFSLGLLIISCFWLE